MREQNKGLYQKYEVKKLTNPAKEIDCIVLEFDDPIARIGIAAWADEMERFGYISAANDAREKLTEYRLALR